MKLQFLFIYVPNDVYSNYNLTLSTQILFILDRLWSAPEIIKGFHLLTQAANQAADIYSVGIILHEILHRSGPFGVECLDMSTYGNIMLV